MPTNYAVPREHDNNHSYASLSLHLSKERYEAERQKSRVLKHQVNDLTFDMYGKEMTEILPSYSV